MSVQIRRGGGLGISWLTHDHSTTMGDAGDYQLYKSQLVLIDKKEVTVGYDIWRRDVAKDLLERFPATNYVVVADNDHNVADFEQTFEQLASLQDEVPQLLTHVVTSENSTREQFEDWMLSHDCDIDTVVIALGERDVRDLVEHVAATFTKDVRFVEIPTSFLAMVDRARTGDRGRSTLKIRHPEQIYLDLQFLQTHSWEQFSRGIIEIIKIATVCDVVLFEQVESFADSICNFYSNPQHQSFERIMSELSELIINSMGTRYQKSNFGRTFGQVIYDLNSEESSVTVGMALEAELAGHVGVLPLRSVKRIISCLKRYKLPTCLNDMKTKCTIDQIMDGLSDRNMFLLLDIGNVHRKRSTVKDKDIRFVLSSAVRINPYDKVGEYPAFEYQPPGSKSMSIRAILLAALGEGTCILENVLRSDDIEVMLNTLEILGISYGWKQNRLKITGTAGTIRSGKNLHLPDDDTASRSLITVAALSGKSTLIGDRQMNLRHLLDALRSQGVRLEGDALPLEIVSSGLKGGIIEVDATISSQHISSILMCAPYAKSPVTLKLIGEPISQSYLNMTVAMMSAFGINVVKHESIYHVPKGTYRSPSTYKIEPDAISATYLLAAAAITGACFTIPDLGVCSLQPESDFAMQVLRPMGCMVWQDKGQTIVTGPPTLKAAELNMISMTNAIPAASILAAVAKGTTKIIGKNTVKELLHKFGVACRDLDNGIEVEGGNLKSADIDCRDPHLVMSASILALACSNAVIIHDKMCIEKVWPGWWTFLSRFLKVKLTGIDVAAQSMFLIGMRGAGKTTAGQWAAETLGWKFLDLDSEIEKAHQLSIPEIIEKLGWEGFRTAELEQLKTAMLTRRHVVACGGGIVETPACRQLLKEYRGIVLNYHRNTSDIVQYLNKDKTRPAFQENMLAVYEKRKGWYQECSNYQYTATTTDEQPAFSRFIHSIGGTGIDSLLRKEQSFFLSLTAPMNCHELRTASLGCDAVELRVDLLDSIEVGFVERQISALRVATTLPIIFTVRSQDQGGQFSGSHADLVTLYKSALRMGVEFLDLEVTTPKSLQVYVLQRRRRTKIIASYHGRKSMYEEARRIGDIVKLTGVADSVEDNFALQKLRKDVPLIAINIGEGGKLSRVLNNFMTPVTHPLLPPAAPGQMSAAEIRSARNSIGELQPLRFKLLGLEGNCFVHNELFKQCGLPHRYDLLPTACVDKVVKQVLRSSDFGGASVDEPLKESIVPHLDDVADDAVAIGAVDTVAVRDGKRIGFNTEWRTFPKAEQAMVLGTNATARAAVYALQKHGTQIVTDSGANHTTLVVSTQPLDRRTEQMLKQIKKAIVLEIAPDTRLTRLCRKKGWDIIQHDPLAVQCAYQFEIWNDIHVPVETAKDLVAKIAGKQGV